jgi:hypothetical protein
MGSEMKVTFFGHASAYGEWMLDVSGRFKINHSRPAFDAKKNGVGFYTKRAPRFGFGWRLCEFWWKRRRDVVSQFLRRIIVGVTSDARRNAPGYARLPGKLC